MLKRERHTTISPLLPYWNLKECPSPRLLMINSQILSKQPSHTLLAQLLTQKGCIKKPFLRKRHRPRHIFFVIKKHFYEQSITFNVVQIHFARKVMLPGVSTTHTKAPFYLLYGISHHRLCMIKYSFLFPIFSLDE